LRNIGYIFWRRYAPVRPECIVAVAYSGRVVIEAGATKVVRLVNTVMGVVDCHCCLLCCVVGESDSRCQVREFTDEKFAVGKDGWWADSDCVGADSSWTMQEVLVWTRSRRCRPASTQIPLSPYTGASSAETINLRTAGGDRL
jgi:hypothetical protein